MQTKNKVFSALDYHVNYRVNILCRGAACVPLNDLEIKMLIVRNDSLKLESSSKVTIREDADEIFTF